MNGLICRYLFLSSYALLAGTCCLRATTLSSNLDQPASFTEVIDPSTSIASSFGTGSNASTLLNVQMLVQLSGGVDPRVWLYSDQGGQPGKPISSLELAQKPAENSPVLALFAGQNLLLSPNSTYWVVAGSVSGTWEWTYTESTSGSGVGFQHRWGLSRDEGKNWFISNLDPMMMSVQGSATATPEPASLMLLGFGAAVLLMLKKHRAGSFSVR